MTVSDLIIALSSCDPKARVTASTVTNFDEDSDYLVSHDQEIEGIDIGFSDEGMSWDLSFSKEKEGYLNVPTIHLRGHFDPIVSRLKE